MKQNILGYIFLLLSTLGCAILFFSNSDLNNTKSATTQTSSKNIYLNKVWKSDFERLQHKGNLPAELSLISQIILIPTDPLTKELSSYLKVPIKINKEGKYRLEVTIITHQSEKNRTQILLQHNLIDFDNENTIWELNKTYNLSSK